jgi:hypothetical protein
MFILLIAGVKANGRFLAGIGRLQRVYRSCGVPLDLGGTKSSPSSRPGTAPADFMKANNSGRVGFQEASVYEGIDDDIDIKLDRNNYGGGGMFGDVGRDTLIHDFLEPLYSDHVIGPQLEEADAFPSLVADRTIYHPRHMHQAHQDQHQQQPSPPRPVHQGYHVPHHAKIVYEDDSGSHHYMDHMEPLQPKMENERGNELSKVVESTSLGEARKQLRTQFASEQYILANSSTADANEDNNNIDGDKMHAVLAHYHNQNKKHGQGKPHIVNPVDSQAYEFVMV